MKPHQRRNRPDIILLVLDTQRADRLSCYGYPVETSPCLDSLASDSTLFTHAVSPAQWTVPSHASLFTGLYPSRHTMRDLNSVLPPSVTTLAERLKQSGYHNALFSSNPLVGAKNNGLQRGFDHVSNFHYPGLGVWTSHLPQVGSTDRRRIWQMLVALSGYRQGRARNPIFRRLSPAIDAAIKLRIGSKDKITRRTLGRASRLLVDRGDLPPDQPLFVFINLMGTHVPYQPPRWATRRFVRRSTGEKITGARLMRINAFAMDMKNWLRMEPLEEGDRAILNGLYDAEVAAQDRQIGKFIDTLRDTGTLDGTFLAVVADHGDHLGEKHRLSHVHGACEELLHVPLLIRDPTGRLPRGGKISPFVSTRRLFHTALAAAEATTLDEERLSLLDSGAPDSSSHLGEEHDTAFAETTTLSWVIQHCENEDPSRLKECLHDQSFQAAYSDAFKLIRCNSRIEVFNVRNDPTESKDLSRSPSVPTDRLLELLDRFQRTSTPAEGSLTQEEEDEEILKRLQALGYAG